MREIKSFDEVLFLLKSKGTVVQFSQGTPVYFVRREDKIRILGKNANYKLDETTFKNLFEKEKFYEVEQQGKDEEISAFKDEEYYNWKHK